MRWITRRLEWDGTSQPPLTFVIVHRLLGPPVAALDAVLYGLREAWQIARTEYRATRSYHADRWTP